MDNFKKDCLIIFHNLINDYRNIAFHVKESKDEVISDARANNIHDFKGLVKFIIAIYKLFPKQDQKVLHLGLVVAAAITILMLLIGIFSLSIATIAIGLILGVAITAGDIVIAIFNYPHYIAK